ARQAVQHRRHRPGLLALAAPAQGRRARAQCRCPRARPAHGWQRRAVPALHLAVGHSVGLPPVLPGLDRGFGRPQGLLGLQRTAGPHAMTGFPDRFNLGDFLLDHNLRAGRGAKVALRWRDEAYSYEWLASDAARLARAFTDLGLRMEERVLLAVSDRPEFATAWFATLRAGAVFAMV